MGGAKRGAILGLALLGASLAACVPPRDVAPETPRGSARICVVRPESTLASEVVMPVRDNGRLVGATRGASFFCWLAGPGDHQITSIDDDTGPTLLRVRAGMRYWLHHDVALLGGDVHAHLDSVGEAEAAELLEACDARVHVAVPGHEDSTDAMPVVPSRL